MSSARQLFHKLEDFRKKQGLTVVALCRQLDIYTVNYYRWKKAKKISGAYKKIIQEFLKEDKNHQSASRIIVPASNIAPCPIAVIGVACYYPGASNIKELWENILARRVQFRRMLDQRLPLNEYYDPDPKAPEKTYLTKAAFIEDFQFDWGRLRIPKKTVESTDIAHWLALDIALKTFEDAGYKLDAIPLENTGVVVGNTLTGEQTRSQTLRLRWPYVQKVLNATLTNAGMGLEERSRLAADMEQVFKSAFYPITEDSLAGGLANTIAGRICNYLNFKGGGYIVDGACSSSLLAVATAADALRSGHLDLALAGGVDISLDPFELVGFAKAGALAREKMSVYDQGANGFLPGEGCGFVLLKRLDDALKDNNYVYAAIKGWGISSDGRGGIMEPSSSGQAFAIARAYKGLDYKIADVNFVEGHGTGTTKGDRVELEGIASAIDQSRPKDSKDQRTCGVTSFKSIVGHTKAAAGVGGLIKAILAVNQRVLPPTANCLTPNEVFRDKARHMYPLIEGGLLAPSQRARAGISSAGFGGINCHVTVESHDPPKKSLKSSIDERALFVSQQHTEVFVFSSRSLLHLKKIIDKFKQDLRNISMAEMADLAALLNKKAKERLGIKAAIVTDSPEHLYDALLLLQKDIEASVLGEGELRHIEAPEAHTQILIGNKCKKARLGFLYPGQGSQRLNMTRTLLERYSWARDLLQLSTLPLHKHICKDLEKLTTEQVQESERQLADTRITQPAITASALVWTEYLRRLNVRPHAVAGHSLGELPAFYAAGAFDPTGLVKFAEFRGSLMAADKRSSGAMVSLFCSMAEAQKLVSQEGSGLVVANNNGPKQVIVSGGAKEIEKLMARAKSQDISTHRLNVSNAFHSSFMKPASQRILKSKILQRPFKSNGTKIYSGISAKALEGKIGLQEYFARQVVSPVNFVGLVEAMSRDCDVLIEVGPGRVLTDLVRAINKEKGPLCLPIESAPRKDRDLNVVLAELFVRNVPVAWEELYKNRLIKTFVPVSRKKFIENQCEHPLRVDGRIIKEGPLVLAPQSQKETVHKEEVIPGGLPEPGKGRDNIADLLIDLTQKLTGFDKESITLQSRLLDDLNLDSIKAAELIGEAARAIGIGGQLDPAQISHQNLGQIRDRLHELAQTHQKAEATIQETGVDILRRYQDKGWVRNFVQKFVDQELTTRNINQFKGLKNIAVLSEPNEPLVDLIQQRFRDNKSKVQKIFYENAQAKPLKIDCLIAVLPRQDKSKDLDKESLKEIIKRFNRFVALAHSAQLPKDGFVVLVQFGGGIFGESGRLDGIAASCGKSLASTLYLERPDLKVRVLDFHIDIPLKEISAKIIDECQTYENFNAVGYDAGLKRRAVYYEQSGPLDYKKRGISWSAKDVVLVTGGAKGITAQCALEFAKATKARMVLVGRSPLPKKNEDDEINQTLNLFRKENLKASYYSCDVGDEKSVAHLVKEIERKEGKITGFIHGAGLNSLKKLNQVSVTEALNESLPKVLGAVNVCKALAQPPKLVAAITSIIGVTGMDGSGWYGLANEILDLYLHQFKARHPQAQVVAIAYSIWDEIGMGAKLGSVKLLANKGIGAIPVKEGVRRFCQLLEADPGVQQIIVAARMAGIDTWRFPPFKANHFRFIDQVEYIVPGIELIARAHLNVKDDAYLIDHDWKGSLLFPFVFGFEAMAQAVAYVMGFERFEQIAARDIDLQRPIPVPVDVGATIEIHAQVLERTRKDEPQRVKVEIYSKDTRYTEPHFSATFELEAAAHNGKKAMAHNLKPKLQPAIEVDISKDIYGPILFQGRLFQGIERIHGLHCANGKGECVFSSVYHKSTPDFLKEHKKFHQRFLTGDPFFIDTLFQSMQLIIPQDICLPRDIERIEVSVAPNSSQAGRHCQSQIKKLDEDYYRGDSQTSKDGPFVKIINCRLKVLDTVPENPTANDLVDSSKRDQKIIEDKLAALSKEWGFTVPVVKCLYDERLKNASRELRHKIELPLMKAAVEELFKRDKQPIENFTIKWLKSGKPVVECRSTKNIGISVSHKESLLIVIAGHGEQGCDIERILDNSEKYWINLLGKENYKLLYQVKNQTSYPINQIGSIIWSVLETIKKITEEKTFKLTLKTYKNEVLFFNPTCLSNDNLIISFPVQLLKRQQYVVSLFIRKFNNGFEQENKLFLGNFSFEKKIFDFDINRGIKGEIIYKKRFPVTFKHVQNLDKTVNFVNYFDWMGDLREFSLAPIIKDIKNILEKGKLGVATNSAKVKILGELKSDDIVEGRFWLNRISGKENSVFDLVFDWLRLGNDNNFERVALSEQRISWIKITGHGEGVLVKPPPVFYEFMKMLKPKEAVADFQNLSYSFQNINAGSELFSNIRFDKFPLKEGVVETTLNESNLVGNIYFANYPKWSGHIRDSYFYKIAPQYFHGNGCDGEFTCVNCEINHLSEAMPFDKIKIKMYLQKIYENGFDLYFDFFKLTDIKESNRLAYSVHKIVSVKYEKNKLVPKNLPKNILNALIGK